MKILVDNKISLVLILMAAASLVSMIATLVIDRIVHHDLYGYGLQFSREWAVPYWTMAGIVFSMGWLIILTSTAFELHFVIHRRRGSTELVVPSPREEHEQSETSIVPCDIKVIARNTGTALLTINEAWIKDVKQTSVSPALPCSIEPSDETLFVISTSITAGSSCQVRLVSARGTSFICPGTVRPREMTEMKEEPNQEPAKKRGESASTALSKSSDHPNRLESELIDAKVVRRKTEDEPTVEQ